MPRKDQTTRYKISWTHPRTQAVVTIEIRHTRDYLSSGTDHVEVETLKPRKCPIPITETGYRSHFMPATELINAGGPVAFVEAWLKQAQTGKEWKQAEAKAAIAAQGDLFQWADAAAQATIKKSSAKASTPAKHRSPSARSKRPRADAG